MDTKSKGIRILVADDNEQMRGGLCALLQSRAGWIVCAEAINGEDAVEKAISLRPDVILIDISMPRLNGLETARCIHEQVPQAEILLVTEHDSRVLAHLPIPAGVRGYLMKSRLDSDLISAVEAASQRRQVSTSTVAQ